MCIEQENVLLKWEMARLKAETARLRTLLIQDTQEDQDQDEMVKDQDKMVQDQGEMVQDQDRVVQGMAVVVDASRRATGKQSIDENLVTVVNPTNEKSAIERSSVVDEDNCKKIGKLLYENGWTDEEDKLVISEHFDN